MADNVNNASQSKSIRGVLPAVEIAFFGPECEPVGLPVVVSLSFPNSILPLVVHAQCLALPEELINKATGALVSYPMVSDASLSGVNSGPEISDIFTLHEIRNQLPALRAKLKEIQPCVSTSTV